MTKIRPLASGVRFSLHSWNGHCGYFSAVLSATPSPPRALFPRSPLFKDSENSPAAYCRTSARMCAMARETSPAPHALFLPRARCVRRMQRRPPPCLLISRVRVLLALPGPRTSRFLYFAGTPLLIPRACVLFSAVPIAGNQPRRDSSSPIAAASFANRSRPTVSTACTMTVCIVSYRFAASSARHSGASCAHASA